MRKEFVIRGQTESGETEVLNFSGNKSGYAYRLTEFKLYPSNSIGAGKTEACASITAGKTAKPPADVNFNDEGLIGTAYLGTDEDHRYPAYHHSVLNDTFLITQNLILMVLDSVSGAAVNWQCRFVSVKMKGPEEAATNYKQFTISDTS